jgi:hypothetical protein
MGQARELAIDNLFGTLKYLNRRFDAPTPSSICPGEIQQEVSGLLKENNSMAEQIYKTIMQIEECGITCKRLRSGNKRSCCGCSTAWPRRQAW